MKDNHTTLKQPLNLGFGENILVGMFRSPGPTPMTLNRVEIVLHWQNELNVWPKRKIVRLPVLLYYSLEYQYGMRLQQSASVHFGLRQSWATVLSVNSIGLHALQLINPIRVRFAIYCRPFLFTVPRREPLPSRSWLEAFYYTLCKNL